MTRQAAPGAKDVSTLYPHIHAIEPLLKYDDFTLAETPLGGDAETTRQGRPVIDRLQSAGALNKTERVREGGKSYWRYEWVDTAREDLREYLADLDTLPCGDRVHLPDRRGMPDGVIECKYCGREYDRDRFETFVREYL